MRNIVLFCFVSMLWGCHTNKPENIASEVIKINPLEAEEFVNLSEIADSVKCIRLQVDSADVMGRVREIVIREKYIYVQDITQQCIFLFDKAGKFVSKLNKRGEGPGEYHWLGPFYINDEQTIDIIDKGVVPSKLKKYSLLDFQFLGESSIINLSYNSSRRKGSYYYFATQQIDNVVNDEKTNADLIVWNDQMQQTTSLFDKKIETNHSSFCPNVESFTQNRKGELFISMMYDNTFYQLNKDSVKPCYTVDFGTYNMNNSIGKSSLEKQMKYIESNNQQAFFPVLTMNDDNILGISYYFKEAKDRFFAEKDFRQYIKLKKSNKVYHMKRIKNDITSFPSYMYISSYFFDCVHEVWYKDYLVDIIQPSYYFKENNVKSVFVDGVGEITSEDDPIIVMARLKEQFTN